MHRVRLLVLNAAVGPLDYRGPDGMAVEPGAIVLAPLGPRQITGVVWEPEHLPAAAVPEAKLRALHAVLPVPPLAAPLRRLIEWTADYYCAPLAAVARMALPDLEGLKGARSITEYRLSGIEPARQTSQRTQAMAALSGAQGSIRELAALALGSGYYCRKRKYPAFY